MTSNITISVTNITLMISEGGMDERERERFSQQL
jgi:hypothetical protein